MKKILIMDDNEDLLRQLETTITKFEVVTTKTVEEAVQILESQDISFFVVDLDLGYEKTGEIAYDLIFSKGKSIPAIVLSGKEITDKMREYLLEMGFSSILTKEHPEKRVSDLVEEEAQRILDDCAERIKQVRKNVERLRIGGKPLSYNGQFKSIDDWIKSIANCNHTADDMKEEMKLKTLIINVCRAMRKRIDEYEFDEMT